VKVKKKQDRETLGKLCIVDQGSEDCATTCGDVYCRSPFISLIINMSLRIVRL
jgi:hypothetical protein